MRILFLLASLLATGCVAAGEEAGPSAPDRERLAAALGDRVPAGPPQACVRLRDLRGNRIVDERTIVFEGPGDILYVNRTRNRCSGMREWHALRLRTVGTQMCEGELVVAFDPTSGIEYGGCSLGRFEPFRRP